MSNRTGLLRTSFVPTITATGTAGTPAYTTNAGSFIQHGKMVFFKLTIVLSGWTGTPTTRTQIVLPTGCPLPIADSIPTAVHVISESADVQASSVQVVARLGSASRSIDLYEISDNSTLVDHAPDTGATYTLNGWYFTDQ